jgi:hypothetical protein
MGMSMRMLIIVTAAITLYMSNNNRRALLLLSFKPDYIQSIRFLFLHNRLQNINKDVSYGRCQ